MEVHSSTHNKIDYKTYLYKTRLISAVLYVIHSSIGELWDSFLYPTRHTETVCRTRQIAAVGIHFSTHDKIDYKTYLYTTRPVTVVL